MLKPTMLAIGLLVVGCGEDEEEEGAAKPKAGGQPTVGAPNLNTNVTAGAPGAGSAGGLPTLEHVEDRVNCPVPRKAEDLPQPEDRCEPTAPAPCKDKAKPYCLVTPVAGPNISYCYSCVERDNIRHAFKDRDFAPEQNRDPFQSFVLAPVGLGSADKPAVDVNTQVKCNENNSFMASYSYVDLKLVGIVTQGTLRKGLVTGGRSSAIIKRNDCVGKEKALVKEVGDGFVTFVTQPDPAVAGSRAVEYPLLLRPNNTLSLGSPESPPSDRPATTVPPPGGTTVPAPGPTIPAPKGTKIEIPAPKQQPNNAPPQPQMNLTP
jgi:hypothetical protein